MSSDHLWDRSRRCPPITYGIDPIDVLRSPMGSIPKVNRDFKVWRAPELTASLIHLSAKVSYGKFWYPLVHQKNQKTGPYTLNCTSLFEVIGRSFSLLKITPGILSVIYYDSFINSTSKTRLHCPRILVLCQNENHWNFKKKFCN